MFLRPYQLLFLTVAALAAGLVAGRLLFAPGSAAPAGGTARQERFPASAGSATAVPAAKSAAISGPRSTRRATTPDRLADLNLLLCTPPDRSGMFESSTYDRVRKLAQDLPVGDIPQALALADKSWAKHFLRWLLMRRWAETDLDAALAYAQSLPAGDRRDQALMPAMEVWADRDLNGFSDWVRKLNAGALHDQAWATLVRSLAKQNPEQALELALSRPAGNLQTTLVGTVVSQWAFLDSASATEWFRKLPAGPLRQRVLSHLSYAWTERDPKGAADYALQLPAGSERSMLAIQAVTRWAGTDRNAALAWVNALPGEWPDRSNLVGSVISVWAADAPREAAEYARGLPAGDAQTRALQSVVSGWSRSEPRAAADWVREFPDSKMRDDALASVMQSWANSNADEAEEWLKKLPAGKLWDSTVVGYVRALSWSAPERVAPWAETITDETPRNQALEQVARNWLNADADAARAWIATCNLPDVTKAQLLKK